MTALPIRPRWATGLCPCCGMDLDCMGSPMTVAEGVRICGWCVEKGHDAPDIVSELLTQLLA